MKIRKDIFLYLLLFGSTLPILIPAAIYSFNGTFTLKDSFWILGSITGLLMFLAFFWEYLLSIKSLVRYFTEDVISVINLHRWIGINALLLILLHPITLILESLINRNELLIKIIPKTGYDFKIVIGELLFLLFIFIFVTSYLARKKISFRIWKYMHYLTYLVLPITYLHADDIGTFLKSPFIKYYILLMMLVFMLICAYRALEYLGFLGYRYVLKSVEYINKDVIQIILSPDNHEKFIIPKYGQFVEIKLNRVGESHPFTVFQYDSNSKNLHLAIKKVGKFTAKLEHIKSGKKVYLSGPYGIFTRESYYPTADKIVMIAGGIGITPFFRFISYLKNNYSNYGEIYLFYSSKTIADMSLKSYLDSLKIPNLKIIYVFSKEKVELPYETGYINSDLLKKYLKSNLRKYQYFICGSENLMDSVTQELRDYHVGDGNIYKEEFGW